MQKRFSLNKNIIESFRVGYFILTHGHSLCIFKLYADYAYYESTTLAEVQGLGYGQSQNFRRRYCRPYSQI